MSDVSFGRHLWDQWESVESYTKVGTQSLERFNEFLKRRAEIEGEYAKALQKLARSHKDEAVTKKGPEKAAGGFGMAIMSGTVSQSWLQLLTVTEHTAAFHTSLAEQLDGEMRKSIKAQIKDNDKLFKQQFDEIRKQTLEYRKQTDNLEKTRLRYDKATKDMDAARQAYEVANQDMNKTAKDIERLRTDAEKKAMLAQECATAYKQCIEQTNQVKDKFYTETIPSILDDIQSKDESSRIDFTKKAFLRYADLLNAQTPSIASSISAMTGIFDKISPTYDSATFVKLCKTGTLPPNDFMFEERALTPNAATAGKKTLARGFTKTYLEAEDNKEDAIVAMPGKHGRKKAVERIKLLDKELSETEKKKQGCETLINVYVSKPEISQDPKVRRDMDDQINGLNAHIDVIKSKKHRLQCYIAQVDGVPAPDPPAGVTVRDSPMTPFTPEHVSGEHRGRPESQDSFASSSAALEAGRDARRFSGATGMSSYLGQSQAEDSGGEDVYESSLAVGGGGVGGGGGVDAGEDVICKARMVYDFEGAPGDLSVTAGEELDVLEKQDDGWWKARVYRASGVVEGFIPGNYTEEI
ncbi:uncharacterized protein EV422DRAFT_622972 [Fimicolochytrium jonesii]|uniref:uncharacterized protein n=1 Tax=Fimicolochytrium jonesii TaxID=1396493 RepID=UPI0022FF4260|nr:uncharacterized protein EV422DRAFT_622972 [Fimicolochytrium jonesii]KAI8817102.1 hypothetical protein EV422DRAFT_622972 [Fimicolochytrium jonesii]